jgi:hypothetical protein
MPGRQRGIAAFGAERPTSLRPAAARHSHPSHHSMTSSGSIAGGRVTRSSSRVKNQRRISWVVAGDEMADTPKVALSALGKVQVHDRSIGW